MAELAQGTTAETSSAALTPDLWLSQQLEMAAFTLQERGAADSTPNVAPAFVQTKVDIADVQRLDQLVRSGFHLVETAVLLTKEIGGAAHVRSGVRFAEPKDETGVRNIARSAFRYCRFHSDPAIPNAVADRLKENWAGNFFLGKRGTHMLVAEDQGNVTGFLLLIAQTHDLIIDLVGVAPGLQGRGFGRAMIDSAAALVRGPRRFVVGTQLANIPSLAYYIQCGFLIERARYSLHRHIA